jgi:RimJ/RimL family protein N-acetyltransferase
MLGSVLEGERVRLEPPRAEHLPIFLRWFADPEVTRFLFRRHPLSERQEAAWLETVAASQTDLVWAVTLKQDGKIIGVTGLHRIDWQHRHGWPEILIGERSEWGKGYATEAITLVTGHAFHELGLEKVLASIYAGNEASTRMAESVGFRRCGLLRRHAFFDGRWHDEWLGEILRDDWKLAATAGRDQRPRA